MLHLTELFDTMSLDTDRRGSVLFVAVISKILKNTQYRWLVGGPVC